MENKIVLYTADYCNHCKVVKMYLDAKGIEYETKDVTLDENKEELGKMGFMSIPVLCINGIANAVNSSNFKEYLKDVL